MEEIHFLEILLLTAEAAEELEATAEDQMEDQEAAELAQV
jgi:hypothetical protein